MRTTVGRLLAVGFTGLLVSTLLVAVTSSPAQAYAKKCFSKRSPGESQSHLECYTPIKRITPVIYKVGYRDSLVNKTNRTAHLDCQASESKTFTYGASLTVSAEIKAGIFASIKAEATVSVSKSLTSGYAVNANIAVPPRTTTYCDRVVYHERFLVRKCLVYYGQTGSCRNLTFTAPSRRGWVLKDA